MSNNAVAAIITVGGSLPHEQITWYCAGCKCNHGVPIDPDKRAWKWNGSLDSPTLGPSVLVTYDGADAGKNGAPQSVCHCYVIDGHIEYLPDCTHDLAGKKVLMEPIKFH